MRVEGSLIGLKDNDENIINNTSHIGIISPYRYRSYYYDNETKLYYLNSRYYNPEWGRFINADGIIGANRDILGYNLYAYVSNNPIKNSDSNGKGKTWDWIAKKTYDLYKKAREVVSKVFGTKTYVSTPIEGSYCTMDNKIVPGINRNGRSFFNWR